MPRRGENIYKRKDGRWEGRYIRGRTPAGKAEYGYVYAKSYAACREKRRKMEGVIPQKPTLTGEMSVAQAVAFFLSDRRGELKASTVGRYEYVISHYKPVLAAKKRFPPVRPGSFPLQWPCLRSLGIEDGAEQARDGRSCPAEHISVAMTPTKS